MESFFKTQFLFHSRYTVSVAANGLIRFLLARTQTDKSSKLLDKNGVTERCQEPNFRHLAEVYTESKQERSKQEEQWARAWEETQEGFQEVAAHTWAVDAVPGKAEQGKE